jgi:hypothetical protein
VSSSRLDAFRARWPSWSLAALVAAGAALRIGRYAANRSLWLDEAAVARNIMDRSFARLVEPLDYGQVAPLGFLAAVEASTQAFGTGEYALRLWPLVAGLAALAVFCVLARRTLGPRAAVVAVALFAFNEPLVEYSAELKQYSTDVLAAIVLMVAALAVRDRGAHPRAVAGFALLGALCGWISHASVFVLVGCAAALALAYARERNLAAAGGLLAGAAAAALCIYPGLPVGTAGQDYFYRSWRIGFGPVAPWTPGDLAWPVRTLGSFFVEVANMPHAAVGYVLALIGSIVLVRRGPDRFLVIAAPVAVTMAAALVHAYPFWGRVVLFLLPAVLILIAAGAWAPVVRGPRALRTAGAVLVALLVLAPLEHAITTPAPPHEELRPVMEYMRARMAPGDALYVYYGAGQAFRYYAARLGLSGAPVTIGRCARNQWDRYVAEVDALRDRGRTWVLFSHYGMASAEGEDALILQRFDALGPRLDEVRAFGAFAVLYDLRGGSAPPRIETVSPAHRLSAPDWSCGGPLDPIDPPGRHVQAPPQQPPKPDERGSFP